MDTGENLNADNGDKGLQNTDSFILLVPCTSGKIINAATVPKAYISPKEYRNVENPADYITFDLSQDFIIVGDVSCSPIDENDEKDGLYHRMNNSFDGVYTVKACSYYSLIPHFEVIGK